MKRVCNIPLFTVGLLLIITGIWLTIKDADIAPKSPLPPDPDRPPTSIIVDSMPLPSDTDMDQPVDSIALRHLEKALKKVLPKALEIYRKDYGISAKMLEQAQVNALELLWVYDYQLITYEKQYWLVWQIIFKTDVAARIGLPPSWQPNVRDDHQCQRLSDTVRIPSIAPTGFNFSDIPYASGDYRPTAFQKAKLSLLAEDIIKLISERSCGLHIKCFGYTDQHLYEKLPQDYNRYCQELRSCTPTPLASPYFQSQVIPTRILDNNSLSWARAVTAAHHLKRLLHRIDIDRKYTNRIHLYPAGCGEDLSDKRAAEKRRVSFTFELK